jgi:hypothetical protein
LFQFGFPRVEISRVVQAPCRRVWDLLVDTTRWGEWGPSVVSISCADRHIREGSTGWVETPFGLRVPFRITEFEEGRSWAWTVGSVPATGHRVEPVAGGRCRLVFTLPTLAAPYALVCWIATKRIAGLLK